MCSCATTRYSVSDSYFDETKGLSHLDEVGRYSLDLTMLLENKGFEERNRRAQNERTRFVPRRRMLVNEHLGRKMVISDHAVS